MTHGRAHCIRYGGRSPVRGFTLIEMIVALAIIGIGASIFVRLYTASADLGRAAQNQSIAIRLAEQQIAAITHHPEQFQWNRPDTLGDTPFPISLGPDDPKSGNPFGEPSALPADLPAREREKNLYERFRWRAHGRLPFPNAPYYEVTVIVQWKEAARPKMLALTTSVPRTQADTATLVAEAKS